MAFNSIRIWIRVAAYYFILASSAHSQSVIIAPEVAYPGERVRLTIIGHDVRFEKGRSTLTAGPDITIVNGFQVESPISGSALLQISGSAPPGPRTIRVATSGLSGTAEAILNIAVPGADVSIRLQVYPARNLKVTDFLPSNSTTAPLFLMTTVFNDIQRRDLTLRLSVTGSKYGTIVNARKQLKQIQPNERIMVTNRDFEYSDQAINIAFFKRALSYGSIPSDEYTYIVSARAPNGVELASASYTYDFKRKDNQVSFLSPGNTLDRPPAIVSTLNPVLRWSSTAAYFDITLYPVRDNQTSEAAISRNTPILRKTDMTAPLFRYPSHGLRLVPGKTYAWRVSGTSSLTGRDVSEKSDMYWFTLAPSLSSPPADIPVFQIDPPEKTMNCSETARFRILNPVSTFTAAPPPVIWSVVPSAAGSISSRGIFTAGNRAGVCAIKAVSGTHSDFATITINCPDSLPSTPRVDESSLSRTRFTSPAAGSATDEPGLTFTWDTGDKDSASTGRTWIVVEASDDTASKGLEAYEEDVTGKEQTFIQFITPSFKKEGVYHSYLERRDSAGGIIYRSPSVEFSVLKNRVVEKELTYIWAEALKTGRLADSIRLIITLETDSVSVSQKKTLEETGARFELAEGSLAQVKVPFSSLGNVARLPFITFMSLPAPHCLHAQKRRQSGATGPSALSAAAAGPVKVAVLDFGFDPEWIRHLKAKKNILVKSTRQDGEISGNTSEEALHGELCAKAVMENAPHAKLALVNFDTELEFIRAIRFCIDSVGVDIISCSVSWLQAYDHYDGTSSLWKRVDEIIQNKAIMVVSAGNFARAHWEGNFRDENQDGSHDMAEDGKPLKIRLKGNTTYNFVLSWNEWGNPLHDLDLSILDTLGRTVLSPKGYEYKSDNVQRKESLDQPVERIRNFLPQAPGETWYLVDIQSKSKNVKTPPHFEMYIYPSPVSSRPGAKRESSLASGMAVSKSENIFVIGTPNFIHGSLGASNDERARLDYLLPGKIGDGVGEREGTSFSAARFAGLLASLLHERNEMSLKDAMEYVRRKGREKSGGKKSMETGWGELRLKDLR